MSAYCGKREVVPDWYMTAFKPSSVWNHVAAARRYCARVLAIAGFCFCFIEDLRSASPVTARLYKYPSRSAAAWIAVILV